MEIAHSAKTLGNTDMLLTRIGLGTWAIGGPWDWGWGPQDDGDSVRTIHAALDAGLNWIDTAASYGAGHSERIVGRALKQCAHEPYVFTKCGTLVDARGQLSNSLTADSVRRECESSLKNLGVESIDLYQIHQPQPDAELEEGWEALLALKEEGKIQHLGVSNFSVSQMRRLHAIAAIDSLQPPYSLLEPGISSEILPFCESENIGVIAHSTMASGLLSGRMTRERIANLPADDWRHRKGWFEEPRLSRFLGLVEGLREIGDARGCTPGEVAIAWTLNHSAVTGSIVGMRHPDQIAGVVHAASFTLEAGEVERIESSLA